MNNFQKLGTLNSISFLNIEFSDFHGIFLLNNLFWCLLLAHNFWFFGVHFFLENFLIFLSVIQFCFSRLPLTIFWILWVIYVDDFETKYDVCYAAFWLNEIEVSSFLLDMCNRMSSHTLNFYFTFLPWSS